MGWNEISNNSNDSDKIEYSKLPEGNTTIRIVDKEPISRWTHFMKKAQRSITCLGKGCPVCSLIKTAKDNKQPPIYTSSKRHLLHVINRSTGKLELFEQGKVFFEQLLAFHEEIGDVQGYDIKVVRKGTDTDTKYTLIPMPAKPLSEEDIALLGGKVDLKEYIVPPTMQQALDLIAGKDPKEVFGQNTDDVVTDEEIEVDFTKKD